MCETPNVICMYTFPPLFKTTWVGKYYYPHFIDEKTDSQRLNNLYKIKRGTVSVLAQVCLAPYPPPLHPACPCFSLSHVFPFSSNTLSFGLLTHRWQGLIYRVSLLGMGCIGRASGLRGKKPLANVIILFGPNNWNVHETLLALIHSNRNCMILGLRIKLMYI